jgi:uncharacterized protein (DUF1810 family)
VEWNVDDPHDLQRFVEAQDRVYAMVCAELRAGEKTGHWMWFIFPQLQGLGHSQLARHFAIASLAEARAYLQHPVLGTRLRECGLLLQVPARPIGRILAYPDDLKLRSCMTLFAQATPDNQVFLEVLARYFDGAPDPRTLELLAHPIRGCPE